MAAMILIEEGVISPDDPVEKYIPEFKDMQVAVPVQSDKDTKSKKGKGDEGEAN